MQQIADWLEKVGMPEYMQCFADNKIDVSVLRHLTDHAERAVRAGLELVAVGALKTHAPLQTRVGIARGLVIVGDPIGSGAQHLRVRLNVPNDRQDVGRKCSEP
jgi:class 3 adenylate cyclase